MHGMMSFIHSKVSDEEMAMIMFWLFWWKDMWKMKERLGEEIVAG